jgi:hypothetical protein
MWSVKPPSFITSKKVESYELDSLLEFELMRVIIDMRTKGSYFY